MVTIQKLLRDATLHLKSISDTPQLDVECLLLHVLKKPRAFLYAHGDESLNDPQLAAFQTLLHDRLKGTPIAYIIGEREFWSKSVWVTPDTLIPRPETECLIEVALSLLGSRDDCIVLDLGTGSGAIAIALASEKPTWTIYATDKSHAALQIANKNIQRYDLKNIQLIHSDWFKNIPVRPFHLIISNPPYLAAHDPHQYQGGLQFEPKEALLSGTDGLDAIRVIVQTSKHYLHHNGLLLIEHGYDQHAQVREIFDLAGYKNINSWEDAHKIKRACGGWNMM